VISASARSSEEELINQEEEAAYNRLVELLALPEEMVQEIEQMGRTTDNLVDHITSTLQEFIQTQ
jgi:hypothetical protein